jgi:hypothetical protein
MMSKRLMWTAGLVAAALAPAALGVGVYFDGGLASYGEVEITTPEIITRSDMGSSWAVGGGMAIPVWWRGGAVSPSVELATDVNLSMIDKALVGPDLDFVNLKITAIPIREAVVIGVGVGPSAMVKPYIGFGGGVSIVMWKSYYTAPGYPEYEIDSNTDVKLTFSVPFGCDFRLTPNFSLGPKAEYVAITGEVSGYNPYQDEAFDASVPNIFLFGGNARFEF